MLKFIRTVDKSLEDFFILDLKAPGNLIDNVDDHSPDAFCYGKFRRVSCHFAKESAYSLIGRESSCRDKYVVLHGGDCGTCKDGEKKYYPSRRHIYIGEALPKAKVWRFFEATCLALASMFFMPK